VVSASGEVDLVSSEIDLVSASGDVDLPSGFGRIDVVSGRGGAQANVCGVVTARGGVEVSVPGGGNEKSVRGDHEMVNCRGDTVVRDQNGVGVAGQSCFADGIRVENRLELSRWPIGYGPAGHACEDAK
jgi:hypothetical protein